MLCYVKLQWELMWGANTGSKNEKYVSCADGDRDAISLLPGHINLVAHNLISAGKSSPRYYGFDRAINGRHKAQYRTTASRNSELDSYKPSASKLISKMGSDRKPLNV